MNGLRDGDAKGGSGMTGEVDKEVEQFGMIRAEVEGRDGDAMRFREVVGWADTAPMNHACCVLSFSHSCKGWRWGVGRG